MMGWGDRLTQAVMGCGLWSSAFLPLVGAYSMCPRSDCRRLRLRVAPEALRPLHIERTIVSGGK
jgi:hypothetical protein